MSSKVKKLIILNIPYIILGLFATKLPQAFRLSDGVDFAEKLRNLSTGFSLAFERYLPSFHHTDFVIGILLGGLIRLFVYMKGKNAKKF